MKTARFTEVVEKSGAPETYLLWVPAAEDKAFQRALKEHRIMTMHQEIRGGKKDFGRVGYYEEPNAQYLLFPKSLRRFHDRRVIGINYGLLAKRAPAQSNKVSAPPKKRTASAKPTKKDAAAAKPEKRPENVVEFAPVLAKAEEKPKAKPERPRPEVKPKPAPRLQAERKKATDELPASVIRELETVLKELRAGKSVVAYERLAAVVNGAKSK